MKKSIVLLIILLIIGERKVFINCVEKSMDTNAVIINDLTPQYYGICYGPFRKGQNPNKGIYPTESEIKEDLAFISKFTKRIRTYGNADSLFDIPRLAEEVGLECYSGVWLGRDKIDNEKEIERAIKQANNNLKNLKGIIVGNEVILRNDLTTTELSQYIKKVKGSTNVPVGIADSYGVFLEHPEIAENADFIMVHIHPYWEGISAGEATETVLAKFTQLKAAFPDRTVIIGETGFPSDGKTINSAVPTLKNLLEFFKVFTEMADKDCVPYFYFSAFDEDWKKTKELDDSHWGIYNCDGTLKSLFTDILPPGFNRIPSKLSPVPVKTPFAVYTDAVSDDNYFQPTGYMGDFEKNEGDNPVNRNCTEFPQSGESCVKIKYTPGFYGWAGVYWQYPINNWGESPGYTINNSASKLTFWARGERGGEWAEFKVGGITGSWPDSINPPISKYIVLSKEWKEYSIDLKGKDLSHIIGGFAWVTNEIQNPNGSTIYLDNIKYE